MIPELKLTKTERRIYFFLLRRAATGLMCTHNEIYDRAMNELGIHNEVDQDSVHNYVAVYIRYLRKKGVPIKTIHGWGYIMELEEEDE